MLSLAGELTPTDISKFQAIDRLQRQHLEVIINAIDVELPENHINAGGLATPTHHHRLRPLRCSL